MKLSLCALSALVVTPLKNDTLVALPNGDGSVRGKAEPNHREFLGIPYAAPPVGPLRWMPTVRNQPWGVGKVLDVKDYKPNCQQLHYAGNASTGGGPSWPGLNDTFSEDCLYLNVYAPRVRVPRRKYPVWVFLYGGDYSVGGPNDLQMFVLPSLQPANETLTASIRLHRYAQRTVAEVGDVVVVVPAWRQGIFGGMASEELRRVSSDNSTGNYQVRR